MALLHFNRFVQPKIILIQWSKLSKLRDFLHYYICLKYLQFNLNLGCKKKKSPVKHIFSIVFYPAL